MRSLLRVGARKDLLEFILSVRGSNEFFGRSAARLWCAETSFLAGTSTGQNAAISGDSRNHDTPSRNRRQLSAVIRKRLS
jgi:hypothetical protein